MQAVVPCRSSTCVARGHGCRSRRHLSCRVSAGNGSAGGPWPWSRRSKPAPPPLPPVPPPPQPSSSIEQDLLRTSPKWRSWPAVDAGAPPQQQQQQRAPQKRPGQQQQQQQQQQQLSPQQQQALQDMLLDSTINPKWRWPMFSSSSSSQQQQQQQQPPPPPPPPPPPQQQPGAGRWWGRSADQQLQQQQHEQQLQQYEEQQQLYKQQQQQQWQWPFVGGRFKPTPEEEFKEQLEAMGIDLSSSKEKQQQRQRQQQQEQQMLSSFDQLDDKEVARYMSQMRKSRLQKVQNRQDDEVVGIAGLYLAITLVVLFMAALANLPI